MRGVRSACGVICIFLLLWAQEVQNPTVNSGLGSTICVLRTQEGVDIRASVKPSTNARHNLHQTLDLTNARCCFNLGNKCPLTEHLNVTLKNITSVLKYPIHPLWMVVSNKRIPHLGVWDELWYSLYEFGKPSVTQTVAVQITRTTDSNAKEAFSFYLSSENSAALTQRTKTSASLVINPHHPSSREDRIILEDVFLLIPEVKDNMEKDSQTRRGQRDYLVLNQSLFWFPNFDCFNEKTRFLSLVDRQHRRCVEASSVDLEKQPYDFYVMEKVKELRNESTEFFLSSFGSLQGPATLRHRSYVAFTSQQPLIIHIFIPNEKPSYRSTAAGVLNAVFVTISLNTRHLVQRFRDQLTVVTDIIREGYDVIAQKLHLLASIVKVQWSVIVSVLNETTAELCDVIGRVLRCDRIPYETSFDYQWNLIWLYIDHACQKIGVLEADGDAKVAVGCIVFSVLIAVPVFLVKWLVTSCRHPAEVESMDDTIMLDNDNGTLAFGREDLLADFLQDALNTLCLSSLSVEDDTIVNGTNTTIARLGPSLRPSVGLRLTRSDLGVAVDISCKDGDDLRFLRLTVSDSRINYSFRTGRSNSSHRPLSIGCDRSDCDTMYPTQSLTEIRSVETSRDQFLETETTNNEICRPRFLMRSFSLPCINTLAEVDRSTDEDEEYRILDMNDCATKVSSRGTSFQQDIKCFIEDIDNTYGAPSKSDIHFLREGPSSEDEGTNLDKLQQIHQAQLSGALDVYQEYTLKDDTRKALKNSTAKFDKSHGSGRTPSDEQPDDGTDLDDVCNTNMSPEERQYQQAMRDFYGVVDETFGARNLSSTHVIGVRSFDEDDGTNVDNLHQSNIASEDEQEYTLDENVRQAIRTLISEVDKTHGNGATPLSGEESEGEDDGTDLDKLIEIKMNSRDNSTSTSSDERQLQQTMKDFHATNHSIKEENSDENEDTLLDKAKKYCMTHKSSTPYNLSLSDEDFEQVLKDFLTEIDETYTYGNNNTSRPRFTNFLWQCQEVMFYILGIYMDNRFY